MIWFFLLYQFNNEYTAKGEQPIQGILCLNEESAYNKLHYLSSEWQYFPGYLLTPQMLEKNPGYHSRYIYIGEYKEMEPGKQEKSDYSFGTYRMLITLPKKEQTWAISMMEVFSAYRIYINGELVGEVGNPDKNNYIGKSMNRMFTFRASGMVEIVITAADRKYMKSGIQYIPVFGSPVLVNIQREVQILLTGIALSICFCVMMGVLAIHLYTRNREFGIFVLVCLCVIGYTIYPLLRSFFQLSVQPWHALENLTYYLILSGMIWLENCIMEKKQERFLPLLINLWIIADFILENFAGAFARAGIFYDVSWIGETIKWIAAIYMLVNTFGETDREYGKIVLVGSTVYACSLTADRIWHLYEPIVGGWFPEMGGIILIIAFACVLWKDLATAYRIRLTYEVYSQQTELRLLAQKKHYEKLKAQMEETNRVRHDMRQHLRLLATLLEREQYEDMQMYLYRYTREFQEKLTYRSYCKNQVTDAILHYYEEVCREKGISFQCRVEAPEQTGIKDTDFCRLFGNLLENAVEAAESCQEKKPRFIHLQISARNNKLLIVEENSCTDFLRKSRAGIFSGKHAGLGIGTASISEIAARYGGLADFRAEEGIFRAEIFLCLTKKDTEDMLCV